MLRILFRPKFDQSRLKQVFEQIVGNKYFGESSVRLVIPAFNADTGKIHLFKTAHKPEYKQDYLRPASEIISATSAAPTYYPAAINVDGTCYLDGGVWANCPVMVGILEAVYGLKQPIESVSVLSIGTTSEPYHVGNWQRKGGLISWGLTGEAATMFLQAQSSAALGQAHLLIRDKLVRIDNITSSNRFTMDDASAIPSLRSLGYVDARVHADKVNELFLNTKVAPFVPCQISSKPKTETSCDVS